MKLLMVAAIALVLSACATFPSSTTFERKGTWTSFQHDENTRMGETVALLHDGRVLLLGGSLRNGAAVATAEIFDPRHLSWSAAANMPEALSSPTVTVLADGRVLATGGEGTPPDRKSGGPPAKSAMIFDPTTGSWTKVASMSQAHFFHTAVQLADGRVMVIGGASAIQGVVADTEILDLHTGAWATVANPPGGGTGPIALVLHDGRVLFTGASFLSPTPPPISLYDPTKNIWTTLDFPASGFLVASAFETPDGRIAGFERRYQPTPGGINDFGGPPPGPVDVFPFVLDVANGSAKLGTAMPGGPSSTQFSPSGTESALLHDGRILTFQSTPSRALIYDPARDSWSVAPTPPLMQSTRLLTLLSDGRVLRFGGDSFAIFNPNGLVAGPSPASIGSPELSWWLTVIAGVMVLLVGIQYAWSRLPQFST
jgi:Galactose oxidase, central domain/Kelch motif